MTKVVVRAAIATIVLAFITGLLYPLVITAVAQLGLGDRADGSLVTVDGRVVGSSSIGQTWSGDRWFYGRPSVVDDDATTSSGSNLGPSSSELADDLRVRGQAILKLEGPYTPGLTIRDVPVDLLTSSASGLDPDISEAAAMLQVPRIAVVRGLSEDAVRSLVREHVQGPDLGFIGESRVNVLELNLALDRLGQ